MKKFRCFEPQFMELPADADLRVIAALFRTKLPARGKRRQEMETLRAQYRNDLKVMVELKKLGLLDPKP
jgi:hypothetical protein